MIIIADKLLKLGRLDVISKALALGFVKLNVFQMLIIIRSFINTISTNNNLLGLFVLSLLHSLRHHHWVRRVAGSIISHKVTLIMMTMMVMMVGNKVSTPQTEVPLTSKGRRPEKLAIKSQCPVS